MAVSEGEMAGTPVEALVLPSSSGLLIRARAFYELGKPNLTLLVVITGLLGYYLAVGSIGAIDWLAVVALVAGTALTSMGACALNMYIERDIDCSMTRTEGRPIPSGRITAEEGLAFSLLTFVWGLGILAVGNNLLVALLSLGTGLLYAFVYTPSKRWGPISTWLGAIPGAVPPVMGWAAVTGEIGMGGVILFVILFAWQFPHFLALAFMLKDDYDKVGFRFLPTNDPTGKRAGRQMFIGTLVLLAASVVPTGLGLTGWIYAAGAVVIGLIFAAVAVKACFGCQRPRALRVFLASISYLPALFALIVLDSLLM